MNSFAICCLKKKKQKEGREKWAPFASDSYGVVKLEYLAQEMFRIEKKFTSGLCSQLI